LLSFGFNEISVQNLVSKESESIAFLLLSIMFFIFLL